MKKLMFILCLCMFSTAFSQFNIWRNAILERRIGMIPRNFSRREITFELDKLQKMLEHVHPNIYHSRSKEDIKKVFENAKASLPRRMNRKQYFYLFSTLLAEYKDEHITALPLTANWVEGTHYNFLKRGLLFPLGVHQFDKELFVTKVWNDHSEIQMGDIILKINGYNADSLFNAAKKHILVMLAIKRIMQVKIFNFY